MTVNTKQLTEALQPRLQDYASQGDLRILTQFVGANPATVQTWTAGKRGPLGVFLCRLWHFLRAAGYDSPELQSLPDYCLLVSELFAYDVVTLEEVCEITGVLNTQDAHKIMRGQQPVNPKWNHQELRELYGETLDTAKAQLQHKLQRRAAKAPPKPPPQPATVHGNGSAPPPTPRRPDAPPAVPTVSDVTVLAASQLSAALAYARHMNSDRVSPAERERLRELMGDTAMFELSNIVSALCGERARTQLR